MNEQSRAALIHLELIQLAGLIAIAVVAFFFTRGVAVGNRELARRDAAAWYTLGEQALRGGRAETAADAFRRAVAKDPERRYTLALASALAETGANGEAEQALLSLREQVPDDPAINLELARLAARQDHVDTALRYYHNALYAPWPDGDAARPRVRLELARFLIAHRQAGVAASELVVSSAELPDTPRESIELAQLFAQAGDTRRALEHYERALRADPTNPEALAGAGEMAYDRGDYAAARRYLQRAAADTPRIAPLLTIAGLVISADPLAPRLGSAERARRLIAAFEYTTARLAHCDGANALADEAAGFAPQLRPPAIRESDTIDAGVDLITHLEQAVVERCPPATAMDRALLLIGARHGAPPS